MRCLVKITDYLSQQTDAVLQVITNVVHLIILDMDDAETVRSRSSAGSGEAKQAPRRKHTPHPVSTPLVVTHQAGGGVKVSDASQVNFFHGKFFFF